MKLNFITTNTNSLTSSSSLEDLKEQVRLAQEASQAAIQEATQRRLLEAQLRVLTNPNLQAAKSVLGARDAVTKHLQSVITACEVIVRDNPVVAKSTGQLRGFGGNFAYQWGDQISLVAKIVTGIKFSVSEHKSQMLALTGLSESLVDVLADAFGSLPYFSEDRNEILPEVPPNLDNLQALLPVVEEAFGVSLDVSKVTFDAYNVALTNATNRAEKLANAKAAKLLIESAQTPTGGSLVIKLPS